MHGDRTGDTVVPYLQGSDSRKVSGPFRRRWLSRRALLLHVEVAVVASGCAIAGWWQATRALAGNSLSWVYSVEWPLFALLAIWGWWHLLHEDPEAYRRRRMHDDNSDAVVASATLVVDPDSTVTGTARDASEARLAKILAMLVSFELVLGFVALGFIPFSRPRGWIPSKGEAIYLAHASFGVVLVCVATVLLIRSRGCTRAIKLAGRLGFSGLLVAAAGGLLTEEQSLIRFLGMTLMLVGAVFSVFGYMIPTLHMSSRELPAPMADSDRR